MKRRKKRLHPILVEINRHKRAIGTLTRAAKMIGIDLEPISQLAPKTVGPKKAAVYHRQMAAQLQAPPDPLEIPARLKRKPNTKPLDKMLSRVLGA